MPPRHQPHDLEDRLVNQLSQQGLIRRHRSWRRDVGIAAAASILGASAVIGGQNFGLPAPAATAAPTHLFALYSTPAYRAEGPGDVSRSLEYGRWAAAQRAGFATVQGGAELAPGASEFGPGTTKGAQLAGYFLVRARSRDEALALARTNPHLRHGGTVIVHDLVG